MGVLFKRVDSGLMQTITSDLNGGVVVRRLMLSAVLPLILGWLIVEGQRANFYDPTFGISLMAVLLSVIYGTLIWRSTKFLQHVDENRQCAEEALRESEARYSMMTLAVPEILFTSLPDGRTDYTSQRFYEYTGMPPGAAEGFGWTTALHPDDRERCTAQWMESVKTGQPFEIEFRFRRVDGVYCWFRSRSLPMRDALGNIIKWYGVCMDIDDQKRTKEALRESEQRYRLLVENVPQLFRITRPDGFVEYFNQRWLDYTGLKPHETLGWDWQQVVHPDDLPLCNEHWTTGLRTGNQIEVQYRLKRFDGVYRWHIAQALPLRDANDTILKWYGTCTDIDDRKLAEEALRQSESRLRQFVKSDIIGIIISDVYGGFHEANDEFLRIVGYTRKDFLAGGLSWTDMTPPQYLPLDYAAIAEAKQRGVCTPYEKEYIRKDGTHVPILIGYTLIGEQKEEAIAFILDMTDLRNAQAALTESEKRFRYVTDTAPMMIWMSGADKLCTYFNQSWLNFTGRTIQQELGNGWAEGLYVDDEQRCLETYVNAFDTHQDFQMEYRLRRFDGEYRWILAIGVPRFTPAGEFLGYIGSCIDINDRKLAEAQIQQLNETLEERVKQRTAQLEAANKELESFSYSVSHDLRAPLRHITGFVNLLQKRLGTTTLDETSQRYINIISESTKQAGKLIDDLLAFSRMGRTEMRYTMIDMSQLVREVQRELEPETRNSRVSWQIEPLPQVQGDPSMLRLAVRNLLENALKYTKTRPVAEITVGSHSSEQEVIFLVRDNGIGFDMRYIHKLFGVFQRLHSDPQFEGTGVGLANVQRIIHRHGGRVWAESEIDSGATFYFALPKGSGRGE